jgi:hypothetical protein
LNVLVDGTPLPRSVWGQPAPFYPGQHEVRANAADKREWTVTFEVNAEHVPTVVVPVLDAAPLPIAIAEPAPRPARTVNRRRTAALVLGGAGVAALGVGAIVGLSAISTYQSADCEARACTPGGIDALSRSHTEGNIATVAVTVGAGALLGAAILWFAGPSSREGIEIQGAIDGQTRGVLLRGAW